MFPLSVNQLNFCNITIFISSKKDAHSLLYKGSTENSKLFFLKKGSAAIFQDEVILFSVESGSFFYLPDFGDFEIRFGIAAEYQIIAFHVLKPHTLPPFENLAFQFEVDLAEFFYKLSKTTEASGPLAEVKRKELLYALFAAAATDFIKNLYPAIGRIICGVASLEAQYLKNFPVSRYAAMCGLHENRFRAIFTEFYKMSPIEYRNILRLNYAENLMQNCNIDVASAAHASGFSSVSYFCRLYRKVYSRSPTDIKENFYGTMDEA